MPKIELYADALYGFAGKRYTEQGLEEVFPCAKAELDGSDPDEGILKVELNDTNRPDLWSTAGLGRQLCCYETGKLPSYSFFSTDDKPQDYGDRIVEVDPAIKETRPFIVAFAIFGKGVDEATLKDLIQTQEKLCWNFGRKRKSIAMGVYRSDLFAYPIRYKAVDPDTTKFVPLQEEREMSLRQILNEHPKGKEFGHIVAADRLFPFIVDKDEKVLSFPPIINSAEIGAVKIGDGHLFVELTGTVMEDLALTASIVACDLADAGYTILPVKVVYPYDTPFGREVVFPRYFQQPIQAKVSYIQKLLGEDLSAQECIEALSRMGVAASSDSSEDPVLTVRVPEYRNDFLHPADVAEDVMIGRGVATFPPVFPSDYTIGRLSAEEHFARRIKDIMVGLGYQEMMYNYLGSRKDYIEKMHVEGKEYIRIANPMTENYEYVRASILPNMLESESVSGNAVYPHKIFETGKIARLDETDNSGTVTKNCLGFLISDREAGFNDALSHISAIFYYIAKEYDLRELDDPRFISGRCARIFSDGKELGLFGEIHPVVLESWGIQMPCAGGEIDLDLLLAAKGEA
ncbi:phenylalanine--tRNA ligase subunit beta [Sediminispirochaeta smaragdinae]|uniref:Phenylalanine--tRNA ligase beta subunit n=1 Tax=Sediminispirochaeta smaragdinae (strain DSM 11293 / JCM 15392 / SEBR 4228) TaxID=573413 RepID=E1R9P6_SEDSS|nr:phenylalanine--tRNA ligase subunit beta [Sediminispirochaeta smaragdinae]ADK83215.1 phenylalanyl-tRNA synthetase, beta subunit [Sediminispirochaeta smaragdinae DSM 11293]